MVVRTRLTMAGLTVKGWHRLCERDRNKACLLWWAMIWSGRDSYLSEVERVCTSWLQTVCFHKYLLRSCSVADTVAGGRNTWVNKSLSLASDSLGCREGRVPTWSRKGQAYNSE